MVALIGMSDPNMWDTYHRYHSFFGWDFAAATPGIREQHILFKL